ncbi:MAG: hypothetical protein JST12_02840 [Armatimonadetes bacterium]|nr:hypothetical protein [Armatimonadota bacterium]MBS1728944.1 hypothetical protein [Armatimonadota bacterium]
MKRTVLVGHPSVSWRAWIKENRGDRDFLCLDPSDAAFAQPGLVSLFRGDKPAYQRFYGSLDATRAPHVLFAALVEALTHSDRDLLIQLFVYRVTPLLRQTLQLVLHHVQPDEVLIPEPLRDAIPTGQVLVGLDKSFPNLVQIAQRKARWLDLLERSEAHVVDLAECSLEGSRLGSGYTLSHQQRTKLNLEEAYVEVIGSSLFVVAENEFEEWKISRAMDFTHTSRVHLAAPDLYEGALCSFAKKGGEDFGFGMVERIDFDKMKAFVRCTAIPPVPVPVLRIGSLRIDAQGNEHGELKPWQI